MAPKDFLIPHVDLTTLRGPELRSLLDAARNRGQADLSYQILQEMAARREGARPKPGLLKGKRAPAEPHLVALDFGDPLDRDEEPAPLPRWNLPPSDPEVEAAPQDEAQPEPEPEPDPPLRMELSAERAAPKVKAAKARASKVKTPKAEASPEARTPERPRAGRSSRLGLGFALGVAVGLGAGWWLSDISRQALRPPMVEAAAAPAPAAVPPPPALEAPVPQNVPDLNAIPAPGSAPTAEAPAPIVAETPKPAARPEPEPAEAASAEAVRPEPVPAGDEAPAAATCSKATPADRAICDDPRLQRLQAELRQAYAEALEVHQDRATLRQRQLAWRDARNDISDPEKLARLYEARIRTLKSATADARRQQ